MEKLTLELLAPYLPYKLLLKTDIYTCKFLSSEQIFYYDKISCKHFFKPIEGTRYTKPILRPLSDLTKEIEVNGERFVPFNFIFEYCAEYVSRHPTQKVLANAANASCVVEWMKPDSLSYNSIRMLFEWHFDVHGLIPSGHAISIHEINKGE